MHEEVMAEPVSDERGAEKEEHEDSCLCGRPVTFWVKAQKLQTFGVTLQS